MPFLALSNINIEIIELGKLIWKSYTIAEILPITNQVELIDKKEFAKILLNKNFEVHVAALEVSTIMLIYLLRTF